MAKTLKESIVTQVYDLYLMMRGQANMLFPSELVGLRPNQLMIMHILYHYPDITMGDLAKRINVAKTNLTPLVDDLIVQGYAQRTPGKKDRRTICVNITEKGNAFIKKLRDHASVSLDTMLQNTNEEEQKELLDALTVITKLAHMQHELQA